MQENFVLEMAKGINEHGQQQIDRFLELIKEASQLQEKLIETLIKAAEIEKEMTSEERGEMHLPIFEIITLGEKILAHNPYIEAKESLIESMFEFTPDGVIASLK